MKLQTKHFVGIGLAVVIIVIAVVLFRSDKLFYFILVTAGIIASLPFMISIITERSKQKNLEERFLEFTRDLVENVKSGTPISRGIINLKTRNYGSLSPYVEKLSNQISLGIPMTEALITFARDTKSPVISRAVSLIAEAEKSGGQIDTILESVSNSVNQTEELKKERKAAVYNLIVQGYIIFLVFILIMLLLEFKILPMIPNAGSIEGLGIKAAAIDPAQFSLPLLILLLVQSFFSGLVIGKISEGSLKDGLKHSFILLAMTLLIKTGASALFG